MSKKDGIEQNTKTKKPIFKKWWFWLIIVIIIFAAISGGSKSEKKSDSKKEVKTEKNESKPVAKSESKEQESTPVTFEQLANDYKANGAAADDKYKGKVLKFQGPVTKITKGAFSGSDVTIDAGNFTDNEFMKTTAVINMSDDVAKTLTSGQTYTFQAKLSGTMVLDGGWIGQFSFTKGTIK